MNKWQPASAAAQGHFEVLGAGIGDDGQQRAMRQGFLQIGGRRPGAAFPDRSWSIDRCDRTRNSCSPSARRLSKCLRPIEPKPAINTGSAKRSLDEADMNVRTEFAAAAPDGRDCAVGTSVKGLGRARARNAAPCDTGPVRRVGAKAGFSPRFGRCDRPRASGSAYSATSSLIFSRSTSGASCISEATSAIACCTSASV